MLQISCPSCGERGKIPSNMVGARIKCKKCGGTFHVADPSRPSAAVGTSTAIQGPPQAFDGIAVEGLDQAAWTLAPDQSSVVMPAVAATEPASAPAEAEAPESTPPAGPTREYKLLTSRDRVFEGKFDLARLEEVINQYARQGWVAKSMCLPHVKNFHGVLQEEVVVLLER